MEATGGLTTTEAEAVLVVSDWDRAVTATVICAATVAGARYRPKLETVPTVEFPPLTPFTSQVTELLDAFCTVAVNGC